MATGSRPIELRAFPFGNRILSSTGALSLADIPKSLVVIGGGYIGVELGQMYAKFGSKVTILEGGPQILPGFEADLVAPVLKQMKTEGITIITEAAAAKAEQGVNDITLYYAKNGEQQSITAEYALVTVGRTPNTDGSLGLDRIGLQTTARGLIDTDTQCRTAIPHIFAIGDIISGPALAHKASYEAKVAAEVIAGAASALDYKAMPLVVFSDPELASVGLSETECKAKEIPVVVGKSSFGINGRALALKAAEGFVKVIADSESGVLLGAQIVGAEASTLISELALAIEMGANVEDLAMTIHPHPTLGEVIMEAAENAVKKNEEITKNQIQRENRTMKAKSSLYFIIAILLVAGGTLLAVKGTDAVSKAENRKQAILETEQKNVIYDKNPGEIVKVHAAIGDFVKQGDLLFEVKAAEGGETDVLAPTEGWLVKSQ